MQKKSFLFFHFNLFFSSVDESQRELIIKNCYYPIIDIARIHNIPVNIEASSRTLLEIKKIDKEFIRLLNELIKDKKIYFVGSGFNQIIAPLVPYEINKKNLKIGNYYYKKILGIKPETALINEMAYADNIADIYSDLKFKSIILDYENTVYAEKNKNKRISQYCYSGTSVKKKLNIIFASSFLFQQFQNCIYGDISFNKYINILKKYRQEVNINTPIYSGDAEVFNFRGSRFSTERPKIFDEWARVYKLLSIIKDKLNIEFSLINNLEVIKNKSITRLTSSKSPIIVKKQPKYNISRWAVTGRADQKINTLCFKIFKNKNLIIKKIGSKKFYETLLDLWSSDYRTHITQKRWALYQKKINYLLNFIKEKKIDKNKSHFKNIITNNNIFFDKEKTMLFIKTKKIKLSLNIKRGLAIDQLSYKSHKFNPIIGTIYREKLKSIYDGADFYSGNMTHELLSSMTKITDLNPVNPKIYENEKSINICSVQKFKHGKLKKIIEIFKDSETVNIDCNYNWNKKYIGSLRMNNISFLNINNKKVYYYCKNGGKNLDKFLLKNYFDQSASPTKFVSLKSGLGCVDSKLSFQINNRLIHFHWDNSKNFVIPTIQYKKINNQKLLRVFFSNQEFDETSYPLVSSHKFKLKITTAK
jgi:hypothetical protein